MDEEDDTIIEEVSSYLLNSNKFNRVIIILLFRYQFIYQKL